MTEILNADELHPAYVYGRLLAVFEQIQYAALGDVNANVVDKFYGTFSTAAGPCFLPPLRQRPEPSSQAPRRQAGIVLRAG